MKKYISAFGAAGLAIALSITSGCEYIGTPTTRHDFPSEDGKFIQLYFGEKDHLNVEVAVVTNGTIRLEKGAAEGVSRGPIPRIALVSVRFEHCGKVSFGQDGRDPNMLAAVADPFSSGRDSKCQIPSWSGNWKVIRN